MAKKDKYFDPKAPAWARYNGETYKSGFSGTKEQKKASDKAVAEFFAKSKKKSGGGK